MKKECLRDDYEQLLSDMLLMQYRVEVFRRNMQVENGCNCDQLSLAMSGSVDELVDIGTRPVLMPVAKKKSWWSKWV